MKEHILRIIQNNSPEVATEEILQLIADNYQALQLQQTGVVRSNLIDESPEPRINVHRFNESDYHDGKFLK
jgi:hypothetical protein